MKKNIKQVKEISWTAITNNGDISKGEKKRFDYEHDYVKKYDFNGSLSEATFYNIDGTLLYKTFYKYDQEGNKIEEITIHNDGQKNRSIWIYDPNGNEVETAFYVKGELIYKAYRAYSENGRKVESVVHNSNNQKSKSVWINDEHGNNIEMLDYNYDGSLNFKRISKYDSRGNGIEWAHYNQDGILESSFKRKFDSWDNEIEWQRVYDSDLNEGDCLKKSWTYNYDNSNNWTQKIYFENDVPKGIIESEIIYYDSSF